MIKQQYQAKFKHFFSIEADEGIEPSGSEQFYHVFLTSIIYTREQDLNPLSLFSSDSLTCPPRHDRHIINTKVSPAAFFTAGIRFKYTFKD